MLLTGSSRIFETQIN